MNIRIVCRVSIYAHARIVWRMSTLRKYEHKNLKTEKIGTYILFNLVGHGVWSLLAWWQSPYTMLYFGWHAAFCVSRPSQWKMIFRHSVLVAFGLLSDDGAHRTQYIEYARPWAECIIFHRTDSLSSYRNFRMLVSVAQNTKIQIAANKYPGWVQNE